MAVGKEIKILEAGLNFFAVQQELHSRLGDELSLLLFIPLPDLSCFFAVKNLCIFNLNS